MTMTPQQIADYLSMQLGFLERSCRLFDEGFQDEAIRLAVVMRTLFHESRHSVALLARLEQPLMLLSTCEAIPENAVMMTGSLADTVISWSDGKPEVSLKPNLGKYPHRHSLMAWKDWWEQSVYRVAQGDITRRFIARTAADQDGGAHIDDQLEPRYADLKRGLFEVSHRSDGEVVNEWRLERTQLFDLRQMAYEILHSEELLRRLW